MRHKDSSRIVNLNAVIAEVARLMHSVMRDQPPPQTILDRRLGRILADPRLINWALVSLATRAMTAREAGGELVIATANREFDRLAARAMHISPGAYAQVKFTFAGAAVDVPDAIHQVVQRGGGSIVMRSAPGPATTITLLYPALPEVALKGSRIPERNLWGPMILVVDARPGTRESTRKLLEDSGYLALDASGREEAEAILAACRVDIVIVAEGQAWPLAETYPHVKIVAASGFPVNALLDAVRSEAGGPWA